MIHKRFGLTSVELLVALIFILLLMVLAFLLLPKSMSGHDHRLLHDSAHVQQIHSSMIFAARERGDDDAALLRPSTMVRRVEVNPDASHSLDTTANLYAMFIAQNYFNPTICVSPLERNPGVLVAADYDYDAYDPLADQYWDPMFRADLNEISNVSYAHLVLHGERLKTRWRMDRVPPPHIAQSKRPQMSPVLGTRGPRDGLVNVDSYTCSDGEWRGRIALDDNSIARLTGMTIEGLTLPGAPGDDAARGLALDNIFAMETGAKGGDVILSFTSAMTKDGPELQWD